MVSEEASGDVGYTHRHQYSNRYKKMKEYFRDQVSKNKNRASQHMTERKKRTLWMSRRNRIMAAKRRAAAAKSSKLQAKKRNARLKKKIKDAQVRRAMKIYDDYTEELEKAQHMNPTQPKPKYTGKTSRKRRSRPMGGKSQQGTTHYLRHPVY